MQKKPTAHRWTAEDWEKRAHARLQKILAAVQSFPKLRGKGPKAPWKIEFSWVGRKAMSKMNSQYRGKNYPTDVLSFPTEGPFRMMGVLGELVICGPVLNAQAKQLKHSSLKELDVLLVHGTLHLLGFDHELGEKEAILMAKWEAQVFRKLHKDDHKDEWIGLIQRTNSGN